MIPILLDLKFIKIYTFGVFLVLAFFWGVFILWKNYLLTAQKEEEMFDAMFLSIAIGLFTGRLAYVIANFRDFGFDILKFILINGYPGLSMYGFLFGAFLTLILYFSSKKKDFKSIIDYVIPSVFLSLSIGKLGSFLSGSEIGTKTKFFLSLTYSNIDSPRHLTSLYESLFFLFGFYLSYKLLFAIRRDVFPKGFGFYFLLWFFSLIYFVFDSLKTNKILILGISVNSFFSLILLLTFSFFYVYHFRSLLFGKLKGIGNIKLKIYGKKDFKNRDKKNKGKTS